MLSRYLVLITNAGNHKCMFWLYFTNSKYGHVSLFKVSNQLTVLIHRSTVSIGLRQSSYVNGHSLKGMTESIYHYRSVCHWIKLVPTSLGISFQKTYLSLELAFSHLIGYRMLAGLISLNPMFVCITLTFQLVLIVNSFYSEYSWRSMLGGVC